MTPTGPCQQAGADDSAPVPARWSTGVTCSVGPAGNASGLVSRLSSGVPGGGISTDWDAIQYGTAMRFRPQLGSKLPPWVGRANPGAPIAAAVGLILGTQPLAAEPWNDAPSSTEPIRRVAGDTGVELTAEYRSEARSLGGYDLDQRHASFIEQRLRAELAVDHDEAVRIVLGLDALDGVVWGYTPGSSSLLRRTPGLGRVGVGWLGVGDPDEPDRYDFVLEPADALTLRHAYGEVWTPVGLLRVGRQPVREGTTLLSADGEGRANRFGSAGSGDQVDRIQLVTHPLLPLRAEAQQDDRGLSITSHYDVLHAGTGRPGSGALQRAGGGARYLVLRPTLEQTFDAQAHGTVTWGRDDDTVVGVLDTILTLSVYELSVGLEGAYVTGRSREPSRALAAATGLPSAEQRIEQWGARFVARWDERRWGAYLELDFASGDDDPDPTSPATRFAFARDANVGLLLFERVLAFETARSAAAAAAKVDAGSNLPFAPVGDTSPAADVAASSIRTEGAFTNAIAFFPQLDLRPRDDLLLRTGVLLAWTPEGDVDPVESLESRAAGGANVNFRGGAPGFLYGTELDGRATWSYREHFFADLEGALLFPGDALENAAGRADTAGLVQGRVTFVF